MSRINLENPRIAYPYIEQGFRLCVTRLTDAAQTLDSDMGPIISITPTASRTLTLPAASQALKGLTFFIVNAAAFTLVVQNPTPTTIATVPAVVGAVGVFVCLGDATQGVGGWSGGL